MSVFSKQYQIPYSHVGPNNTLTLKWLVTILQDTAGLHSAEARL